MVAREAGALGLDRTDAQLATAVARTARQVGRVHAGSAPARLADLPNLAGSDPQVYVFEAVRAKTSGAHADSVRTRLVDGPGSQARWPGLEVAPVARHAAATGGTVSTSVHAGRSPVRLVATSLPEGSAGSLVVVAAASLTSQQQTHATMVHWIWIICAILATLGAAAGLLLARRLLRPLRMVLAQEDRLIASALHEVRAPLARLQVVSESGLSGDSDPLLALKEAERMAVEASHTIDDLAEIAALALGQHGAEVEPMFLDAVVRQAVEQRVDPRPVRLDLEPAPMEGCPGLIRRAVLNLVENAMRHGRRNGRPAEVTVTVRPGLVTVADDGPGMDPVELSRLVAALSAAKHREGLGLGLTIAAWVTRFHHGSLSAENRPQGGLAVTIGFPLNPAVRPAGKEVGTQTP